MANQWQNTGIDMYGIFVYKSKKALTNTVLSRNPLLPPVVDCRSYERSTTQIKHIETEKQNQ